MGKELAEYHVAWTDKILDDNLIESQLQILQEESALLTIHVYYNTCLISVQGNQYALWANVEFNYIKECVGIFLNEPCLETDVASELSGE